MHSHFSFVENPEFVILNRDQLDVAQKIHDEDTYMYQETADVNRIPQYRFSGFHVCDQTWNDAHRQAWLQGWHLDNPNNYIFWYMNQFHDPEIIFDFHAKYLKRILKAPSAPDAPKKSKLTYTQYKYGMLTLSGMTTDGIDPQIKLTHEQGLQYLKGLYAKYFSPQAPRKRDFECNVWIENIKATNNLHMHVFYRRKKGYLKINTGFLQYSKKGLKKGGYNNSKFYTEDANIINAVGYAYDDDESELIHKFEPEIFLDNLK